MDQKDIDIIITWVDNSDPKWLKEYENYSGDIKTNIRFQELGTLKYIFRGIEKFLPWIRKIHFVTYGHLPTWLNINHPKLNLVNHKDIFPDSLLLPVFNASAIEMNFHRIKDLSEKFIYFNDDMFVLKELSREYFFTNNLPNDFYIIESLFHDSIFSHMMHSNMQIINEEIQKNGSFKKEIMKVFSSNYNFKSIFKSFILMALIKQIPLFKLHHHPQPHLKSNFIEVEQNYPLIIQKTMASRFRDPQNVTQYLFRFWGMIKGKYNPKKHNDAYYIGVNDIDNFIKTLDSFKQNKKPAFVCFNEESAFSIEKYDIYKKLIAEYLDKILPGKSTWEL
jgi:hypothetical protein